MAAQCHGQRTLDGVPLSTVTATGRAGPAILKASMTTSNFPALEGIPLAVGLITLGNTPRTHMHTPSAPVLVELNRSCEEYYSRVHHWRRQRRQWRLRHHSLSQPSKLL